jgi:hypothetical protein
MKTAIRLTSLVLAVGLCASAFAGSDQPPVNQRQVNQAQAQASQSKRKVCLVMTSSSAIPIPCERIRGIPTTSSAMDVIGNKSPN